MNNLDNMLGLTAAPEDVGLSAERLAQITDTAQQFVDEGQVAGALTVVARRGKVAHCELLSTRLLRTESVEEMTRNQVPDHEVPLDKKPVERFGGLGFGLGVSVRVEVDRMGAGVAGRRIRLDRRDQHRILDRAARRTGVDHLGPAHALLASEPGHQASGLRSGWGCGGRRENRQNRQFENR